MTIPVILSVFKCVYNYSFGRSFITCSMPHELFRTDGHGLSHTIDHVLENQSSINPAFTTEPSDTASKPSQPKPNLNSCGIPAEEGEIN